jgi:hypothetical protein
MSGYIHFGNVGNGFFFLTIFGTRDEDQQEIDEDEEVFLQGETEIEA